MWSEIQVCTLEVRFPNGEGLVERLIASRIENSRQRNRRVGHDYRERNSPRIWRPGGGETAHAVRGGRSFVRDWKWIGFQHTVRQALYLLLAHERDFVSLLPAVDRRRFDVQRPCNSRDGPVVAQ